MHTHSHRNSAAFNRLSVLIGPILVFCSFSAHPYAEARTPSPSTPQTQADWQRYTVKGEEFSVELPVMPALTTYEWRDLKLRKNLKRRIIGAYADGVVYAIHTIENPNRLQSLDNVISSLYREAEGDTPRDLILDGFSGKEYSFQSADRKAVWQFYITDRNIYVFRAVGSILGNPDVGIPKFLSSIRFERRPEGTAVVDGPGEQPISDPSKLNESNEGQPVRGNQVTSKAIVVTKPEPAYTDAARKNQITGTVVVRAVFSSSGAVTNIRAVSELPHGLTEQAIASARRIKFIPAIKDGRFVSMYIQLEYNFNLY